MSTHHKWKHFLLQRFLQIISPVPGTLFLMTSGQIFSKQSALLCLIVIYLNCLSFLPIMILWWLWIVLFQFYVLVPFFFMCLSVHGAANSFAAPNMNIEECFIKAIRSYLFWGTELIWNSMLIFFSMTRQKFMLLSKHWRPQGLGYVLIMSFLSSLVCNFRSYECLLKWKEIFYTVWSQLHLLSMDSCSRI